MHAYRVHVRTGCIENFLTTKFFSNENHRGPPTPNGDGVRIDAERRAPSDEDSAPPVPRMPTVPPPAATAPATDVAPESGLSGNPTPRDEVIDL